MRRTAKTLGLTMSFILVMALNYSKAQDSDIPFCQNVKLIDANLGTKLTYFKPYKDLQQATLSKTDEGYLITIIYKANGIFQVDKKEITEDDLTAICSEAEALIARQTLVEEDTNQEAKRRFIAATTAMSLGYYGWAIPAALDLEDYKSYMSSYLFIGSAGFFAPFIATRRYGITDGMANAYFLGARLGIAHGFSMALLMHGNDASTQSIFALSSFVSVAESFTNLGLATKYGHTWGQTSSRGSGGAWGFAYGFAIPEIIAETPNTRLTALSMLAFSGAGIAAGDYLYKKQGVTYGDVTVINCIGILGAYYPMVIMNSLDVDKKQAYLAGSLLGSASAIAYGIYHTRDYNYTRQQSYLIGLGEGAGGLVGAGLSVIAEANDKGTLWLIALGATSGLVLTDYLVKDTDQSTKMHASNFRFQFNPNGLLFALKPQTNPFKPWDYRYSNSLVNISYSF
ncbi:MAG TPA: hypothetical protein PLO02_11680 [Tenuifilaceae bacterium]|nr:hypothetical protein [Bacteroidales bacterium]MDI9516117.1 hypothetical protein [Bacteroidota bacterium]NLH57169.1 hypothetical protein [Rikenellaceae bacterium]OQC63779.1 MAG: hypothetical protein BWX49_01062 [Bacteroidetes bacterium ADurb.Bin008]HNV82513.1 hypothetical protein [Tenuifilaceae bacterium]